MSSTVDVSVTHLIAASPSRVREIMFDPRQDPAWMDAVKRVEPLSADVGPGAQVRRVGSFMGRTLRWTTEVIAVSGDRLDLQIVDGPMSGIVTYYLEAHDTGTRVTIRNVGQAPGFAPGWLLGWAMRRSLTADLRRLKQIAEARSGPRL